MRVRGCADDAIDRLPPLRNAAESFAGNTRCQRRRGAQSTSCSFGSGARQHSSKRPIFNRWRRKSFRHPDGHSSRSASMGATLDARSAGSNDAASTVARQYGCGDHQRSWITGGDAVELRPHEPRAGPRAQSADEHPGDRNRQAVAHNHPDDRPPRGAKGHAHADFPYPRRHGIREQPVHADAGQKDRERRRECGQRPP